MDNSGIEEGELILDEYNCGVAAERARHKKTAGLPLGAPPQEGYMPGYTVAPMALVSFCASTVLGTTPTCLSTN